MFDPNGGWLGIAGALDVLRWGDGAYAWYTGTETYFNRINNISTTSMLTNHSGAAALDILYYPWGQTTPWQLWGGGGANFAELPYQDGNSGTNIALYRHQSPGLGRWLSPDPVSGCVNFPQGQNLYAYVKNNPTNFTDPRGDFLPVCDPWDPTCEACDPWIDPDCDGGEPPPPLPSPPARSGAVAACSRIGGKKPYIGGCQYVCRSAHGILPEITHIPLYKIQKACPPPRPDCPISLEIEESPFAISTPTVISGSCVYGKVQ